MVLYSIATLLPLLALAIMVIQLWETRVMRLGWVVPLAGLLIWVAALALAIDKDVPYWIFLVIGTFVAPLAGLIGGTIVQLILRQRFAAWSFTSLAFKAYCKLINTRRDTGNREVGARAKRRVYLQFLIWACSNPFFRARVKAKYPPAMIEQAQRELEALPPNPPTNVKSQIICERELAICEWRASVGHAPLNATKSQEAGQEKVTKVLKRSGTPLPDHVRS